MQVFRRFVRMHRRSNMKAFIIASAIAIVAAPATHALALDELAKYQSKNRVVVLFGGSGDQKLAKQVGVLKSQESNLAERDVVVITVVGDEVRPVFGDATGVDARKLRQEADVKGNTFQAVVIGKDGGVKLRSSDVVSDDKLFELIDSMPMRKAGQG
jgi:hypothetical protein